MTVTSPFDVSRFDDVGFDISHNDGSNLNFKILGTPSAGAATPGGGRSAIQMKLTEGTDFKDPMFDSYLRAIVTAGLGPAWCFWVYHFAHNNDPKGQVHFFLDTYTSAVRTFQAQGLAFPSTLFMLDCERGNNPPAESTVLEMVEEMSQEGVPNPTIYAGYDYFSQDYSELHACSHIVAAYNSHPVSALPWRLPGRTFGWDAWQYTGDFLGPWAHDIPGGIHGMDLSCFNKEKHPEGIRTWWLGEVAKISPNLLPPPMGLPQPPQQASPGEPS